MSDAEREYLRAHAAAHAPVGCRVSQLVLALVAECEAKDRLIAGLCDRVAAQSELLAKRAAKGERGNG